MPDAPSPPPVVSGEGSPSEVLSEWLDFYFAESGLGEFIPDFDARAEAEALTEFLAPRIASLPSTPSGDAPVRTEIGTASDGLPYIEVLPQNERNRRDRLSEWDANRVWLDGRWFEIDHFGAEVDGICTDVIMHEMDPQPTPPDAPAPSGDPVRELVYELTHPRSGTPYVSRAVRLLLREALAADPAPDLEAPRLTEEREA